MSIRVDSSSLIPGAVVVGDPGLGVLAELVPSTGEHGPGIAYTWLGPAEGGKEVRVLITQWPEVGSLFVWEDTSFEYNGPGGTAYAQLYVDGQPVGTPQPVTMVVGAQVSFRALILTDGTLRVLPVDQENTGKKPIVLLDGNLKERVGSEGVPIILDAGALRTLGRGESLVI